MILHWHHFKMLDFIFTSTSSFQNNRFGTSATRKGSGPRHDAAELGTDYASKLLHLAWHPETNVIAAAASNSLYMYIG
jgi:hypothetical protein